jgi:hypothetical protein
VLKVGEEQSDSVLMKDFAQRGAGMKEWRLGDRIVERGGA